MSKGIQIFLKHFNDPEHRYQSRENVCKTDPARALIGCGQAIRRFVTYPREKGIYFDGDPVVIEQFPVRHDGAIIAVVSTDNLHVATCPAKRKARDDARDGKAAGIGGRP